MAKKSSGKKSVNTNKRSGKVKGTMNESTKPKGTSSTGPKSTNKT